MPDLATAPETSGPSSSLSARNTTKHATVANGQLSTTSGWLCYVVARLAVPKRALNVWGNWARITLEAAAASG